MERFEEIKILMPIYNDDIFEITQFENRFTPFTCFLGVERLGADTLARLF